jgi:hypothetical protein
MIEVRTGEWHRNVSATHILAERIREASNLFTQQQRKEIFNGPRHH